MPNWKLKKTAFLLMIVLVFMLAGCNNPLTGRTGEQRAITDRNGVVYEIPKTVDRLISLSPTLTQIILDLDLADKLVGVDTNSQKFYDLPQEMPAFDMMAPDAEQLLALHPDILLISDMSSAGGAEDPFALLSKNGVCVVRVTTPSTLAQIAEDVAFVADVIGDKEGGEALVATMQAELAEYRALGEAVQEQKTVYLEVAAAPTIYSCGSGVFLDEIIELIGAKNVFHDQKGWFSVTPEAAVTADADVILTNIDYIDDPVAEILSRAGWQEMRAIKNADVYRIDANASSQANHHVVEAVAEIYRAVYQNQKAD
ncbi:MAG: ABC transporter substrate-binding protein [Negativicutes bacterium]|nr:ABC transporter substrate-binding protein [Negativicutes bacterium]